MAENNPFFNVQSNQYQTVLKQAVSNVFGSTPLLATRFGATEVTFTRSAAGIYTATARNGGNRPGKIIAITPIHHAFVHGQLHAVKQVTTITTVADSSGSLNNKYLLLPGFNYSTGKPTQVAIWFNVNSAGSQPNVAGVDQYIAVAVATNDSANTVGGLVRTALDGATSNSVAIYTDSGSNNSAVATDNRSGQRANKEDNAGTTITVGAGNSGMTVANTTPGTSGYTNTAVTMKFYDSSFNAIDPDAFCVWFATYPQAKEQ